ncbi:endonuclease V [Roseimicrobium gellanilyticum]|uniref:Endonuclease V n=1 Tax=Roseimicrobium gellanilyticum TaxID=748857 RepID=A0A366HJV3_9BACT|nr:endonuclease V [Roseimicrobium gellanilyticum]RBP42524.1 endonuclease V [Roseimicrobium gellanilyticum]
MIAFLDVHYQGDIAYAAAVVCDDLTASSPTLEKVVRVYHIAAYEPGNFFKRELPCLLAVLQACPPVDHLVIDGNVWLDQGNMGLGAHLYETLLRKVPVIGIAKTAYRGSTDAHAVLRGTSQRPLYVTAAGMDPVVVAELVRHLHGPHRTPTLVTRADQLCRRCGEKQQRQLTTVKQAIAVHCLHIPGLGARTSN